MVELLLACATTVSVAVLAGVLRQRRQAAADALSGYARTRSLDFDARRLRVDGLEGSVPFVVDLVRLEGHVCTRVAAGAARGRCLRVRLVARPWRVRAEDDATAGAALERASEATRTLRTREGLWLASDGARVVCVWPGVERDGDLLDAARRVVTTLADTRPPEAPYR